MIEKQNLFQKVTTGLILVLVFLLNSMVLADNETIILNGKTYKVTVVKIDWKEVIPIPPGLQSELFPTLSDRR